MSRLALLQMKCAKYWCYYSFHDFESNSYTDAEGYSFKLRINLTSADFQAHRDKIISFLSGRGMSDDSIKEKYLDVVAEFKIPTPLSLKEGREWCSKRFVENGQFTLYLAAPCDYDRVEKFINGLQQFLIKLKVAAVAPMTFDFAVKGKDNLSMRLERVQGAYIPVNDITSDKVYAYMSMLRCSAVFSRFALAGKIVPSVPSEVSQAISKLFRYGFEIIMFKKHCDPGASEKNRFRLAAVYQDSAELYGNFLRGETTVGAVLAMLEMKKPLLKALKIYQCLYTYAHSQLTVARVRMRSEVKAGKQKRRIGLFGEEDECKGAVPARVKRLRNGDDAKNASILRVRV